LLPLILGVITLADVVLLFVEDAYPRLFPAGSHTILAALSLALIAFAYLIFESTRRGVSTGLVRAILLAAAFLFWAANQFWPDLPQASLWNDIAIGLFVLDVFLAMAGWPAEQGDGFLAQNTGRACGCCCGREDRSGRNAGGAEVNEGVSVSDFHGEEG
jgi:hypothetical protein